MIKYYEEKFKELMYDLQRSSTDEDSHELILKYSEKGKTVNDNIICIKDVIMNNSGDREFTKGKTYRLQTYHGIINTINDSGVYHGIEFDKGWFNLHFEFI